MIINKHKLLTLILIAGIIACSNPKKKGEQNEETEKKAEEITLTKIDSFAAFPDAGLSLVQPESTEIPEGKNTFQFKVDNYELQNQTSDAASLGLANSGKGQHVHFILNNGPYAAQYENEFTKDLPVGDHVMLAFLSRSYHMSVKNENSYVLKKFRVGEPTEEQQLDVDFTAPHLFYSRPKGTYTGDDTDKVMLDFFLLNSELGEDANYIDVTVNGENQFKVTENSPYAIEGMPMGENTVKLVLRDNEGKFVEGPFNKVERTITLAEE